MQIGVDWCNLVQTGLTWVPFGTDWCSLVELGAD